MKLLPTFLINGERISTARLELLRASNYRNAFIACRDRLINSFSAKAVFCGESADSAILGESVLHINLPPSSGCPPILEEKVSHELTREFQSKFLAYRCDHFLEVVGSRFDLPEFTSRTRVLARILGGPIVNAPAIQAGLTRMLRVDEERALELLWTDLRRVVLEAALHHCHQECGQRVFVGDSREL